MVVSNDPPAASIAAFADTLIFASFTVTFFVSSPCTITLTYAYGFEINPALDSTSVSTVLFAN